jgi:hypothetical protein
MPSVASNTSKIKCEVCGATYDVPLIAMKLPPCQVCGQVMYKRVLVQPACDFCGGNLDDFCCWTYPASVFVYPHQPPTVTPEGSNDAWSACEKCHEFLQAKDLDGLAVYSVDADLTREPNPKADRAHLIAYTLDLHRRFWEHRIGEPFREVYSDGEWKRVDD